MLALRTVRTVRMTAAAVVVAAALTACSSGGEEPETEPTATTPAATPSAEPAPDDPAAAPSEVPDAEPTRAAPVSTPVTIGCNDLVTLEAMYDFNPNFTLDADYSPAPSTLAEEIAELDGLACSWVNNTSGVTIDVAVAQLGVTDIEAIGNDLVQTSNSVPTYGTEGYFQMDGDVGTAQVLSGAYWLVAQSIAFGEPGGAEPIVEAALSQLP